MRDSADVIWKSCKRLFAQSDPRIIDAVYGRLKRVWGLVIQDNGGNETVETNRGQLTQDPLADQL